LSFHFILVISPFSTAGVAELADALDSKSSDRKIVWVRAPPPAKFSTGRSPGFPKSLAADDNLRSI
jgi:hypothetical protein